MADYTYFWSSIRLKNTNFFQLFFSCHNTLLAFSTMKFYVIFGIVATLAVQAALADDSKDSATAATSTATTVAASKSSPSADGGKHSARFSFLSSPPRFWGLFWYHRKYTVKRFVKINNEIRS